MNSDHGALDAQREHWQTTFRTNPSMYGTDPSEPGSYAVDLFDREKVGHVLELGAGQGRDSLAFLRAGMTVTALEYAPRALADLYHAATNSWSRSPTTCGIRCRYRTPVSTPSPPHAVQHGPHHRGARPADR